MVDPSEHIDVVPTLVDAATLTAAVHDPAEFEKVYQVFVQPIYRYFWSRVRDRQDAEELTAQTFLAVLERLPSYRHNGYFPAWLFSIARNKAADFFRRSRGTDTTPVEALPDLAAEKPDSRLPELEALIGGLPESEQDLLRLRFVAELSFADLAALQGRKVDAVKKSLYRLLARLHAQLEPDDE